ncbi:MAG TPA: glycosyltransferase family 39 protein [Patescibacteria group bacterium]|nr:glycosyltransferase family 39 protein [Patescibacteria group bacterium]
MKFLHSTVFLLCTIVLISLSFRLYHLGEMPSGFHRDEVIAGYAGRFIFENGRDFYGNVLPLLYIDKYGDYPPALPAYVSGITTYLFGSTVFAVRFPVAVIGALTCLLFYLLAKELFKKREVALIAAFLLAIIPWHLVLSRATAEGIIALPIVLGGLVFLIRFLQKQQIISLVIFVSLFFLTYFFYPSYRVLIPLLLLPVPFLFALTKRSRLFLIGTLLFFVALTGIFSSTDWGKGRFDQTSMFGKQSGGGITDRISILAQEEGQNKINVVKTYHNKYVLYTQEFIKQYLTYFSPQYLFLEGGLPYRYAVSDKGLLFVILLPFLFFGLFSIRKERSRFLWYLCYLFIISPMPSPFTLDDVPNVHRTLFMIIPLLLFSSFGFIEVLNSIKQRGVRILLVCVVIGILCVEMIHFFHMYHHHANAVKSSVRGDTNKEVMAFLVSMKDTYQHVYVRVGDALPIYYLFATNNYSKEVIGSIHQRLIAESFDNVTFLDRDCIISRIPESEFKKDVLIVDQADCPEDPRLKILEVFYRHDGTRSYRFAVPL